MDLEVCSFMARPNGDGYPGGSRDFWNIAVKCGATVCICNSGYGTCAVPSRAEIGKNGKCKGFQTTKDSRK